MDKTRKVGVKQRFAEIEARLKTSEYNRNSRKSNRNYLSKYLAGRETGGSEAVETRKAQAVGLLAEINEYKSPKKPSPKKRLVPGNTTRKIKKPALFSQVDVKGDGNCFYRALYRSAKEHEDPKVLGKVFQALGADKTKMGTEEEGQSALRQAIANYYRAKLVSKTGPYEMLISNFGSEQYRGWLREATAKQANIYKRVKEYAKMPGGKAKFYADLSAVIGTNEEYASDIDYFMIKDLLEEGGVLMISSKKSPDSSFKGTLPALYVKRLSYDHYNYWRLKKLPEAPPKPALDPTPPPPPKPAPPAAPARAPAPAPAVAPPPKKLNTPNSGESTNNSGEEQKRGELLAQLERRMDRHTRCVEKCKILARKVEEVKKELGRLGR